MRLFCIKVCSVWKEWTQKATHLLRSWHGWTQNCWSRQACFLKCAVICCSVSTLVFLKMLTDIWKMHPAQVGQAIFQQIKKILTGDIWRWLLQQFIFLRSFGRFYWNLHKLCILCVKSKTCFLLRIDIGRECHTCVTT